MSDIQLGPWMPKQGQAAHVSGWHELDLGPIAVWEHQPDSIKDLVDDYLLFESNEACRRNDLRELATRKLHRFADLLNAAGPGQEALNLTFHSWWYIDEDNEPNSAMWNIGINCPPGVVPFCSKKACLTAIAMLTDEEKESLHWRPKPVAEILGGKKE